MITEWTVGDGADTDIQARYEIALKFCESTIKNNLKDEIQDNFTKLKNY